ncbi:phage tail tape measure protein [Salmonella enterica subsp. enterica]|nr:phage tail tape measure protein [Salmonella enterica subsp. enterica]EKC4151432.1 phage tail tape measure protein [Salmonella enterica subsp. enterica]
MSGNAGTLAVNLHVNSATFKADLMDAYQSGVREARRFADGTGRAASDAGAAIEKTTGGVGRLGRAFGGLASRLGVSHSGFEQLRSALNGLAATGNVSAGALANALVPAISKTLAGSGQLDDALKKQREAFSRNAQAAWDSARAQIQAAQAARQQAQGAAARAAKEYEAAKAAEEEAVALARHYDQMKKVNAEYGLSVSYREEYQKINARLKDADMSAAVAKQRVAAAARAVTEAEAMEAAGKTKLSAAMSLISAGNYRISASARVAAASTRLLSGALAMLGGPTGLAVMALVAGGTAMWTAWDRAEQKTKALNAAMLESRNGMSLSLARLKQLNNGLGDTEGSMKAVTAAVKAGFTGDMLDRVSSLASQMEALGGSADDLVRQLSSISGDPVKAMQAATQQGYEFNAAQIEQIATLARQGKTAEAVALVQKVILDDVTVRLGEQQRKVQENIGWWGKLKDAVREGFAAYGNAQIATAKAQAAAAGVDMDAINAELQAKRDAQKKEENARADALRKQQDAQLRQIKTEAELSSLIKAGTDKTKLAAEATSMLTERYKAGKLSAEDYAAALRGVDRLYGEHKRAAKQAEYHDSEGVRRLAQLQQQTVVLKAQGQETERMSESQKKLLAFDQEIASYAGKKLTNAQQSVLAMQSQIRAQLELNAGIEKENTQRRLALRLEQQVRDIRSETTRLQQAQDNAVAQISLSDREYEQMVAVQQIREAFAQKQKALDDEVKDHASAIWQTQTQALQEEMQKQVDIVRQGAEDRKKAEADFAGGAVAGMKNWLDRAGNYAQQTKELVSNTMGGLVNNITAALNGNKASWRDWGMMVIQTIEKIMVNAAIVNALKSLGGGLGGAGGVWGSIGNFISGAVANARGGVYDSPGLSAYSSTIVDKPTLFPFAKGAGLMGEAGPEAILPLTRDSRGRLGVSASHEGHASPVINQHFSVTIENKGGNGQIGADALKGVYDIAYRAAMDALSVQLRDGGVLSR